MAELPLIIFTLFMQCAIGAVACATIVKFIAKDKKFSLTYIIAAALSSIAVLASLLHLGTPLSAPNSIMNLGSSWLSREIVFSGGFMGLTVIIAILVKTNKGSESLVKIASVIASVVGLIAVFTMAKVYMSTVIPAWASWNTLVDFYGATIILGAIMFLVTAGKELAGMTAPFAWAVVIAALVQVAVVPTYLAGLGAGDATSVATASMLANDFGILLIVKWALILVGSLALVAPKVKEMKNMTFVAAAVVVVGVALGRYIFYTAHVVQTIGIM